jgi:hypothetical protein
MLETSASAESPLAAHLCLCHRLRLRLSTAHLPSLPSHTWDNRCREVGWEAGIYRTLPDFSELLLQLCIIGLVFRKLTIHTLKATSWCF